MVAGVAGQAGNKSDEKERGQGSKIAPDWIPKWPQNGSKMGPKWLPGALRAAFGVPGGPGRPKSDFGSHFGHHFGLQNRRFPADSVRIGAR